MTNTLLQDEKPLTVEFLGDHGAAIFEIRTAHADARISLFGGQVLHWKPTHADREVLWTSPLASLDGSKAIRGGVPVCWPWFGAHPASTSLPAHGLARLAHWRIDRLYLLADGAVELALTLPASEVPAGATEEDVGSGLRLSQTVRIGQSLSLALTTKNVGSVERRCSEGLHTYFAVDDVSRVQVEGLDGCSYRDLTAGNRVRTQAGPVAFTGETARLFVGTTHACDILDPGLGRRIRVEKSGSQSTAIWNPGRDFASRMADLGPEAWRHMVCVETANALDDAFVLQPGEQRTMTATYSVEPLA